MYPCDRSKAPPKANYFELEPLRSKSVPPPRKREFLIDNLLVRSPFINKMIWWTRLAPWEFEFSFPGSLISTFLASGSNRDWSMNHFLGWHALNSRVPSGEMANLQPRFSRIPSCSHGPPAPTDNDPLPIGDWGSGSPLTVKGLRSRVVG